MHEHLLRAVRHETVKRRIPGFSHTMPALDTRRPQQITHHVGFDLIGHRRQPDRVVHGRSITAGLAPVRGEAYRGGAWVMMAPILSVVQTAHGLRAGAIIAVPGGLRAERKA